VQKDIDKGKVKPGQYFVLTFDFSKVRPNPNLTEANESLIKFLNSSVEMFYETYAAYLGQNIADLRQWIDGKEANITIERCVQLVRGAIEQGGQLAGIEGIYVIVDEYDAFPNSYLPRVMAAKTHKIAWEKTAFAETFKSFFRTMKSLSTSSIIRKIFITGISPLSLSTLASAFNVARNLSFHKDLAGLCGLTRSNLKDALNEFCKKREVCDSYLSDMARLYNGFHFCMDQTVETVYNTETCLSYLQCRLEGIIPQLLDPENSEISEDFLEMFAASAPVIKDFKAALKPCKDSWAPVTYAQFRLNFALKDLVCYSPSSSSCLC